MLNLACSSMLPVWPRTDICVVAQNGQGLTFAALNDGYNGMSVAMGIMAIEWAVFLVLAWYFEQVLPSGAIINSIYWAM